MVSVEYTNAFLKEWISPSTMPHKQFHVPYVILIYCFCASNDFPFLFGQQRIHRLLVVQRDNRLGSPN